MSPAAPAIIITSAVVVATIIIASDKELQADLKTLAQTTLARWKNWFNDFTPLAESSQSASKSSSKSETYLDDEYSKMFASMNIVNEEPLPVYLDQSPFIEDVTEALASKGDQGETSITRVSNYPENSTHDSLFLEANSQMTEETSHLEISSLSPDDLSFHQPTSHFTDMESSISESRSVSIELSNGDDRSEKGAESDESYDKFEDEAEMV